MAKSNPKVPRPIALKRTMHVVLKSSLARGDRSFLHRDNSKAIQRIINSHAVTCGVKIYRFANSGNHLHLLVRVFSRVSFRRFIRATTGLIARYILKKERGSKSESSENSEAKRQGFWDARPYSRIVEWGKDYLATSRYVGRNVVDAFGFTNIAFDLIHANSREGPSG